MQWSPYQSAVFNTLATSTDNLIINAVAGSGKTTTVLEAVSRLPTDKRVVVCAFNKKIAADISAKLAQRGLTNVEGKTLHAIGFSAVRFANGKAKTEVSNHKVADLVDAYIAKHERPDLEAFKGFVIKAVGMAKKIGIGVPSIARVDDVDAWGAMVDHYGLDFALGEGDDERLDKAVAFAIAILKRSNLDTVNVDFDDMVYLPLVHNYRLFQWDVVVVDEAQDLNATRLLLAQRMLRKGGRFIAVGDPRQAIYGFTGAMADSMQQIRDTFECQELPLSVTYRSARKIVAEAQRLVPHIVARDNAPEGEVVNMGGDEFGAVDFLPTDAVLCRNNAPLVGAAFSALRRGIPCRIEGRDIGRGLTALTHKWKRVKTLDALRSKLIDWSDKEINKAKAKRNETREALITDQRDTLLHFIDAAEARKDDLDGMRKQIESMFADSYDDAGRPAKPMLTFCSYHKSKGLEWQRVYLFDHAKLCPSKYAVQPWQIQQERNLAYVAMTRAMETLVFVDAEAKTMPVAVAA